MVTMTGTTFDNKVKILSQINGRISHMPELAELGEQLSLSLNLATLLDYKIVKDNNDKVEGLIEGGFTYILSRYKLEDTGFDNAWEIDPNIPLPTIYQFDDVEEYDEQDD